VLSRHDAVERTRKTKETVFAVLDIISSVGELVVALNPLL
jgi:hypothetical protein